MPSESLIKQRIHITFGKFDALKYTGTLDTAKLWERVLRRARLPLVYSQGFNIRPRIQLAAALPMGITSECELLDVSLREVIVLDNTVAALQAVSPDGLRIYSVKEVPLKGPALQTLVHSARYRIRLEDPVNPAEIRARIHSLLAEKQILRVSRRKDKIMPFDMRPMIYGLHLDETGNIVAHLAAGDRGNARIEDLMDLLGLSSIHHSVHRFELLTDDDR